MGTMKQPAKKAKPRRRHPARRVSLALPESANLFSHQLPDANCTLAPAWAAQDAAAGESQTNFFQPGEVLRLDTLDCNLIVDEICAPPTLSA
jgi:hypothetical protein